ncbi:DUF1798 family protein [Amphibacillus cookii]|uniref:DUF1798 family protein n=1 Tax=Amphibacillus cookii TaxID=767787 RepID=UPI00195E3637|nr:DUF1798 family protein [Amphibacillus cookii]MBM7542547.1 ABC-type oligopeptide transport system substrate-binding subunit [Amphibacillus cookii]
MLLNLTDKVQQARLQLKERYLKSDKPDSKRDRTFFNMVKNETDPLFELIEKWEELALKAVKDREVSVHPQQVQSTRENFELIILHSYYIDIKQKRYMELHQAIDYVCQMIIDTLTKKY